VATVGPKARQLSGYVYLPSIKLNLYSELYFIYAI